MASHSSILAGKIPWTEVPGGVLSVGTQLSNCETGYNSACFVFQEAGDLPFLVLDLVPAHLGQVCSLWGPQSFHLYAEGIGHQGRGFPAQTSSRGS